jgi:hypothetical protein
MNIKKLKGPEKMLQMTEKHELWKLKSGVLLYIIGPVISEFLCLELLFIRGRLHFSMYLKRFC